MYTDEGELLMITALDKVFNEIDVWSRLHHENIVKLYELIDDESHDYLYLIMDLNTGG